MQQKQLMMVGLVVGSLVVAIVVWLSLSDAPAPENTALQSTASAAWPATAPVWTGDAQDAVALIATDAGPAMFVSPKDQVTLTPEWTGLVLKWTHTQSDAGIVFEGQGTWNEKPATARWVFSAGNPQATFELEVKEVTWGALAAAESQPTLRLPVGDVRHLNDKLRTAAFVPDESETQIDGWTPGWVQWQGQGRVLQYSQWLADGVVLSAVDGGGTEIVFDIFEPESRGWQPDCEAMNALETDLRLRFVLTVGAAPLVVPGRFPLGFRAAVAPVFSDPVNHESGAIKKEAPKTPEKFVSRARTLAMGHSQKADPRYGNGGLAPTNLGGTIVWQGESNPAIDALQQELTMGTDLATHGENARTRLADGTCEQAVALLQSDAQAVLAAGIPHDGAFFNAITAHKTPSFSPGVPAQFVPFALDGTRSQLLQQTLSPIYLNRLENERGLVVVSTPLIATRNPLVGVAADALLQPERDGQWTLDPAVAKALAAIELMEESNSVGFASLSRLATYWNQARQSMVLYNQDGSVSVYGAPGNEPLVLVVDGARDVSGEQVLKPDVVDRSRQPQTWFGVEAPEGVGSAQLGLEPDEKPQPVEWSVR